MSSVAVKGGNRGQEEEQPDSYLNLQQCSFQHLRFGPYRRVLLHFGHGAFSRPSPPRRDPCGQFALPIASASSPHVAAPATRPFPGPNLRADSEDFPASALGVLRQLPPLPGMFARASTRAYRRCPAGPLKNNVQC